VAVLGSTVIALLDAAAGERSYLSVWAGQPVLRTVSVAVRAIRRPGADIHGHMADSVVAANLAWWCLRSSEAIWRCREERTVKPSAQPTLVRTQHLPPPAKTAPGLRKRGPAGRFLLVTPCIRVRHCGSMYGSVRVHMVYSVRVKLAVRITARSAVRRPPTTLKTPTACMPEPRGPVPRFANAAQCCEHDVGVFEGSRSTMDSRSCCGWMGWHDDAERSALWSPSGVEAASTASLWGARSLPGL